MGLLRIRSQAQKAAGVRTRLRSNRPLSKSEVNGSRLVSNCISPSREMLMRSAVIFFVLLSCSLSPPSAASAAPLSLYVLIPLDVAHDSGMISPTVPI
jgi:hypothetical protein